MKFTDYNSPEKAILNEAFNSLPYMDMWISSIVEGYIYKKVDKIDKEEESKEEYILRYAKEEGEYKNWWGNGQLKAQCYYKDGKEEGEYKWWYQNGQLEAQCYYKYGKEEGECKWWYANGKLKSQCCFKEGYKEGKFKLWRENGELIEYKIYKYGYIVKDLIFSSCLGFLLSLRLKLN